MEISEYWKTIVDTFQDGFLVVDPKGLILDANKSAEKITGYKTDELIGQSCRILNCTGCKILGDIASETWCALFAEGGINEKKCLITHKNKKTIHVLKSAKVLYNKGGEAIGAIETITDISEIEQKNLEITSLRKSLHLSEGFHGIIGNSKIMRRIFKLITYVAETEAPVLITGESGTGKELVAQAIHRISNRNNKPFIKVNCAALNENLLESELFGHVKGAFTGAEKTRVGRFEAAHEGTIFLDEIGDIPLHTQIKLLRVLEEKKIERVGDNKSINIDVRIISATNKDLDHLVESKSFREDLYFRINVFPITCPALSLRKEDIPYIIHKFIKDNNTKTGKQIKGISSDVMNIFQKYAWAGNVRELRNIIEYAFVLCRTKTIELKHLPERIIKIETGSKSGLTKKSMEKEDLIAALAQCSGNKTKVAEKLSVSRVTIWKRIKKHKISEEDYL